MEMSELIQFTKILLYPEKILITLQKMRVIPTFLTTKKTCFQLSFDGTLYIRIPLIIENLQCCKVVESGFIATNFVGLTVFQIVTFVPHSHTVSSIFSTNKFYRLLISFATIPQYAILC